MWSTKNRNGSKAGKPHKRDTAYNGRLKPAILQRGELKKNNFFHDHFANLRIDEFCYPGFRHE